jgi:hypothetical protein
VSRKQTGSGITRLRANANFVDHDVMYKEYPQSFVVGVRAPKGNDLLVKVGGKSTDRVSEWVITELLNKEIDNNHSLYNAQVALKDKKPTPTPAAFNSKQAGSNAPKLVNR